MDETYGHGCRTRAFTRAQQINQSRRSDQAAGILLFWEKNVLFPLEKPLIFREKQAILVSEIDEAEIYVACFFSRVRAFLYQNIRFCGVYTERSNDYGTY